MQHGYDSGIFATPDFFCALIDEPRWQSEISTPKNVCIPRFLPTITLGWLRLAFPPFVAPAAIREYGRPQLVSGGCSLVTSVRRELGKPSLQMCAWFSRKPMGLLVGPRWILVFPQIVRWATWDHTDGNKSCSAWRTLRHVGVSWSFQWRTRNQNVHVNSYYFSLRRALGWAVALHTTGADGWRNAQGCIALMNWCFPGGLCYLTLQRGLVNLDLNRSELAVIFYVA